MSNQWLNVAFEDRILTRGARLILIAIADRADNSGFARPSIADIATRANLTRRPVQAALRKLSRNRATGRPIIILRSRGRRRVNGYVLRGNRSSKELRDVVQAGWQKLEKLFQKGAASSTLSRGEKALLRAEKGAVAHKKRRCYEQKKALSTAPEPHITPAATPDEPPRLPDPLHLKKALADERLGKDLERTAAGKAEAATVKDDITQEGYEAQRILRELGCVDFDAASLAASYPLPRVVAVAAILRQRGAPRNPGGLFRRLCQQGAGL